MKVVENLRRKHLSPSMFMKVEGEEIKVTTYIGRLRYHLYEFFVSSILFLFFVIVISFFSQTSVKGVKDPDISH